MTDYPSSGASQQSVSINAIVRVFKIVIMTLLLTRLSHLSHTWCYISYPFFNSTCFVCRLPTKYAEQILRFQGCALRQIVGGHNLYTLEIQGAQYMSLVQKPIFPGRLKAKVKVARGHRALLEHSPDFHLRMHNWEWCSILKPDVAFLTLTASHNFTVLHTQKDYQNFVL